MEVILKYFEVVKMCFCIWEKMVFLIGNGCYWKFFFGNVLLKCVFIKDFSELGLLLRVFI